MDDRISQLEHALQKIEERNARVESDKAWEVSIVRRLLIAGMTYIIAVLLLWSAGAEQFFLSALIPAIGYILSTLSIPTVKKWWISRR
jgi:hypothetical protein